MVSSLVSLISKKIIKPSILTPPTKISHQLSFVDQVIMNLHMYYPYAGRLNKDNGNYVDCNDMGVVLSHIHVHCPMSQIFRQP
uniref:Uncharacterized protein n=1 Tax=Solanum lycopersicum TaxID=4081 RepID=A0A3Q7IK22_SOLLC